MSTGQGLLGNNMFVYCIDNPINTSDDYGNFAKAVGLTGNITILAGASIGIYWVWDDQGNYGLQWSYSHPFDKELTNAGFLDIGATAVLQHINADTIYDIEGIGTATGLSVGGTAYGSVDILWTDPHKSTPTGLQIGIGVGVGYDAHVNKSRTQGIWYNNPNPATKPTVNKPTTSNKRSTVNRGGGIRNRVMMF